ncbi:PAPA-1-like conserved region-domain-containing protein [Protomyces lactucae-debilis]|uniref:PAPA-1-like conserved region-domain-containing protein n=1 Tax=Protomyces lactucae-debilis TaxID=2754530 RepID=A0A1Y2FKF8_PROLT|nr:PAPA-1-like conserved region-domain-containing protein [Protomyces lactucae-debilis]ORY84438.1 PAPA-1-like conserved region-domain-containing protein [Protomyces lactucae-debilis]
METRKRNKRQIDFSSSENEEEPEPPVQYKVKRVILRQPSAPNAPAAPPPAAKAAARPAADVLDLDGDDTSELSEADSLDEEEPELDEEMLEDEPDLQGASDYDDPDEDEEDILRTMMKPMIDKSKKTKRQKARDAALESGEQSAGLWSLPTGRETVKPVLTAEEAALRKSENARKRKNQNEKKLEEEKQETINRLLNKQATKARGAVYKASVNEALDDDDEMAPTVRATRPLPRGMVRYVSNKEGSTVSLPSEALGHPMTVSLFGPAPVAVGEKAS